MPSSSPPKRPPPGPPRSGSRPPVRPLDEAEREELQALLDRVPAPLEALDVSMLDGFLCGVLVQPERIAPPRWLPHVTDVDGRALPPAFDTVRLEALTLRRYRELDDAIGRRQWFDPWVYELEGDAPDPTQRAGDGDDEDEDDDGPPQETDAVYPWVAGFATALELFPGILGRDANLLNEPLALLYRHLAPDDLEDADDLIEQIEALEPPADLAEAVEGLVRATLLLADVGRPVAAAPPAPRRARRPGR